MSHSTDDASMFSGQFHFLIGFDPTNMIPLFEKDSGLPYSVEELWEDMREHGYLDDIKERLANIVKIEMTNLPAMMKNRKQGPWA